jgi:protein-glucosylgalactosylhydroxylysine glucosidase
MSAPISPDHVTDHRPDFLPAYLSNGVIGLRVREIPLHNGVAIVNGLVGVDPVARVECAPRAPYPLGGDLQLGRIWLSDMPRCARFIEQRYDFSCGELHSRFVFAAEGVEARVDVLTFCSRTEPCLALQEVRIEVNQACDVTMEARVDPGDITGRWLGRWTETPGADTPAVDGMLQWQPLGGLSTCGVAYVTTFENDTTVRRSVMEGEQRPLATRYAFRAEPGRSYRLRQIAAMIPSQMHHQPNLQAIRLAAHGQQLGFDSLRRENQSEWADLWKGRVHLLGADRRWQALADAAFYYLQSSVHPSSRSSTAIFGLAQWPNYHYYYGHVMWDIEAFAVPPLLLTQPGAARAMLDYRSHSLPAARANAQLNGYRGLQFPWESNPTRGEEETPLPGTGAWHEEHVSAGVAHAFAQYADATGDERFLREQAWPVLAGVAEWITSRVTKTDRGYEIRASMGIAERKQPIDNGAYMNMAVSVALCEAADCARRLGYAVPAAWADIARHIVIPRDPRTGVILSHDGYDPGEEKGATPDPLAGLFPFGYRADDRTERETTAYYLGMAERYIGSPMLSALYGVWAARLGDREQSARLFDEGYAAFVSDRFLNTHEYREDRFPEQPVAGPFFANLGGFLLGCLYGLPGLRIGPGTPESWCERAVVMPEGWEGIAVERIWVRGQPAELMARHGDARATISVGPTR